MESADTIYSRMMENQGNMDPYLSNQGQAPEYFKGKIDEKFQGNLPAIQNAAALEARAYSLPGELMDKYDNEYGGNTGVGGMSRMNSILKNIGLQFGTSNAAWNVVDQAKVRQSDLAEQMMSRYTGELGAMQTKNSMLSPLWQQIYGEEQAMKRLQAQIAASKTTAPTNQWNDVPGANPGATTTTTTGTAPALTGNSFDRLVDSRQPDVTPADSGSTLLDKYINSSRGITTPSPFN